MPYDTSSRLDPHEKEIVLLLEMGVKRKKVAEKYGVHPTTLSVWLKKKGLFEIGKPSKKE